MTGPELVAHLHQIDPTLPVIILNSNPGHDVSQSMPAGATAFLNKPFNLRDLRQTIVDVRAHRTVPDASKLPS